MLLHTLTPTVSAKTQLQCHFLQHQLLLSPHSESASIRPCASSRVMSVTDHPHPKQWVYRGCLYGKCTGWMNRLNNTKGDTQKLETM